MTMKIRTFAALLACALALNACDRVRHTAGTIGALTLLSEDIRSHFLESAVGARLDDDRDLTIEIATSARRKLSDQERARAALEVARYAYSRFQGRGHLAKVVVSFGRRWSVLAFGFGSSDKTGAFEFKGDDLAAWYRAQSA